MVIIISSPDDGHLRFVIPHLQKPYVVVDAGTVMAGEGLSFEVPATGPRTVRVRYQNQLLRNITGVWYRRPRDLTYSLSVPVIEEYEEYCKSALREHVEQLYALFPDACWVSDKYTVSRTENKSFQLLAARRAGFRIPETLITSDATEATAFVSSRDVTLVKTPSRQFPFWPDGRYLRFYAQKVTPADEVRYEGLHIAPAIFQQLIEPAAELRITVVGSAVFASRAIVEGVKPSAVQDWHVGYAQGSVRFEAYDLPQAVARCCARLVRNVGLHYGAIDLIVDKQGEYWFIEINPNGQWAFVEDEAGLPIGQAMAALLEGRTAAQK